ncbi:major allergen I polypeptide chain 2-like isoform X2 [Dipodomys merriami]|uniref:major allergen I polypeptide chain 2-like isoform X2 n=1 Tax=Dipodomys merriami TaxID=94247 RepID=UPI003855F932
MNQTLLVLALLLLDLGFQSACPIFYGILAVLDIENQRALDIYLLRLGATEEETAAFGKIQDCYDEAGVAEKFLDFILMRNITTSPECTLFNLLVDNGVESQRAESFATGALPTTQS